VSNEFIYWTNARNENVYKMPREGQSAATVIAQLSIKMGVITLAQKDMFGTNGSEYYICVLVGCPTWACNVACCERN